MLFFSRMTTLWESVLWQFPFRSVYLDDHRVHFRTLDKGPSVHLVQAIPQSESWRVIHLTTWGSCYRDDRRVLPANRCHHRPRLHPVSSRQSVGVLQSRRHGAVDVILSGREGDQSSAPTTSTGCRRSLVPQMTACHGTLLSLMKVMSQATFTASCWAHLIDVKRYLLNEVVLAYQWPTDDSCDTTIQH